MSELSEHFLFGPKNGGGAKVMGGDSPELLREMGLRNLIPCMKEIKRPGGPYIADAFVGCCLTWHHVGPCIPYIRPAAPG